MNMKSDKYIKRDMEGLVLSLSEEYSCVLVSGPRQVGKSTMLKHIMTSDRNVVTLDDLNERALAKADPEMFLAMHPAPVLIDEVQYAPELFPYIKMRIDNGAPAGSYWLTGSQAFKLMKLAQESLAGRVALLHLSSISQNEFYDILEKNQKREIEQGISLVGIQRDDFKISINSNEAKIFGSQGQQRTCVLSLKIAETEYIKSIKDEYPVLLLDDIMSELDINRRKYLWECITDKQVIMTCTKNTKLFNISGGRIIK